MDRSSGKHEQTPSRRAFLRDSTAVLVASHPIVAALARRAEPGAQPSPLKTQAQYQAEASQYEAAFRNLTAVPGMTAATDADITRLTTIVSRAGAALDYHDSWMVAICMADAGLVAWVRKEIGDEASFNNFVDSVKRDPSVVDTIPAVSALRTRLGSLKAEKVALVSRIVAKSNEIAGREAASQAAAAKAEKATKCQETWAIVAAVLLIVIATVVILIPNLSATVWGAGVVAAAATLSGTYAGTGADLARSAFVAASQRYAQCIAAAATLPPASRAKAIAACQARWLEDKAAYLA